MRIVTNSSALQGTVQVPSSKSLSNRALMIRAYMPSEAHMRIHNLSSGTDAVVMQENLQAIATGQAHTEIDCRDAGTVFRFILPLLCTRVGQSFTLTGTKRLRQRPIQPLVKALQQLGAHIEEKNDATWYIEGRTLQGGKLHIDASQSSQFVSALCMLAPTLPGGLTLLLSGQRVSFPYIRMTLDVMNKLGIHYQQNDDELHIPEQAYKPCEYHVENDWSSAAFYYSLALFSQKAQLYLPGLYKNSLQGDAHVVEIAAKLGIETTFTEKGILLTKKQVPSAEALKNYIIDYTDYPDLAVPFIVTCAVLFPEVRSTGIQHLNLKESERLSALQIELKKVGYTLEYENGILRSYADKVDFKHSLFNLNTYHDHRLAMAFALLAFTGKVIVIDDAECVRKSFPQYWAQLAELKLSVY